MFIDIHLHAVRPGAARRDGKEAISTPEHLIKRFDAVGIERGVLLPLVSPEGFWEPQTPLEILQMCREHPDRFIPFCNVDPRALGNRGDAPLGDWLESYREQGYKGIGEVTANLPFADPRVQNLFRHVERVGFPMIFHIATQLGGMYGLHDEPGLPGLARALGNFPKLKFLGHSQAFWSEIGEFNAPADRGGYPSYRVREGAVPKLFRAHPNLYGDLSAGSGCNALKRDPDHAVKFLNEFQDRLFFGTDICAPNTPTPLVDFLLELRSSGRISETVFQKVARENAIRLLGL